MPTYLYRCGRCGRERETSHGMLEAPNIFCPRCEVEMHKVFQAPAVIYKDGGRFLKKGGLYRSKSKEPES